MFKKTIEFHDFDGNPQSKDFYFHISKADYIAMAADGDEMRTRLDRIMAAANGAAILQEFRELIKIACGVRTDDGLRFLKDPEAQSMLLDSPAFDELLMELATDAGAAAEFVKQLLPEKMQKEMIDRLKASGQQVPDPFAEPKDGRPAWQKEHRFPTDQELHEMSKEEMAQAMRWRLENNKIAE